MDDATQRLYDARREARAAGAGRRPRKAGNVADVHRDMRAACQGKNIWVMGGGELAGQFHDAGLLDELIIQIGSAILGAGKSLLPRAIRFPSLQLTATRSFGAGMAELRYAVQKTTSDTEP